MMNSGWKEDVRRALSALPKAVKLTEVSAQTGISADRLYQFGSKGVMCSDDLKRLDEWLIEHGFRVARPSNENVRDVHAREMSPPYNSPAAEAAQIVARELRLLADMLESPAFNNEQKIERLYNRVAEIQAFQDSFAAALRQNVEGLQKG